MGKDITKIEDEQEKNLFSFSESFCGKKLKVDFSAPDLSSNGGLLLVKAADNAFLDKISRCIPDNRNPLFIVHSIAEMISQRVDQIMCGYEDANDCDTLRHDSALKVMTGRLPSDVDLCSQPTMTRLENRVSARSLYDIGVLFVKNFVNLFKKAPKRIILDVDDTNANTYGTQELSLFNDYYGEYCYMPMLMFDGVTGKMILPVLRPGRRNKTANIFGILRRVTEYLHAYWPHTIIELRGDSHFCSHEFMDYSHDKIYLRFTTGLSGNSVLLKRIEKQKKRAENDFEKTGNPIRHYYKLDYKASSWEYEQRIVAKVEVNAKGTNIRFVVTSNHNNVPETIYRRYCQRGEMELWIKDLKYLKGDRMSCGKFRANQFRLFLHAAAYVLIHSIKNSMFKDTEVENFTTDSFIKRIMLSAVHIQEKKTFMRVSFMKDHRHRKEIEKGLIVLFAA